MRFQVNGQTVETCEDGKLLPFLREQLGLTSVKNGCSEGACGTCMVLINGKATRACVPKLSTLDGKSVVTVEGLSPREREVYAYAFSEAGAVQCGFCIPGMVISAKALLDQTPDPSPEEVKRAIRNNICRCTGYQKIERAILLAAMLLRTHTPVPQRSCAGLVGENLPRLDARDKILGRAEYSDDIQLPGMLYGGAVRSAYPRARIVEIDVSRALELEGVVSVLTAEDLRGKKQVGHLRKDWDVLMGPGEITRYLGDAIVLIAARSREVLAKAKELVNIIYEPLPPVRSPAEAMAEGAPAIHSGGNLLQEERLCRGDADRALERADYVVSHRYVTPFTEHAFLEPETAVARPDGAGGIVIYSGDQGVYQTRRECAEATGLPLEKVRVIGKAIGGGFGGKEDMTVQHHAAILALATGRPVKVSLSRAESLVVHPKRHAMELEFTTGCDKNGILTGLRARIIADTGAYASLGGPVLQRACTHAAGPYRYQDVDILGQAWYTNNPPAGAFRGFGVTQSCFAAECNLNELAQLVGISPWEIRMRNAVRPGDVLPNGQICDPSTAIVETLEAVKPAFDASPYTGVACALKNSGLGVGIPDVGRCILSIEQDGKVHTRIGASCIGQGLATVITQMICSITGLPPERIVHERTDTARTPDSGNTTASRQTVFAGEAARTAARKLAQALTEHSLEELEGQEFYGEYEAITDKIGSDKPNPVSHVAYGYATQVVQLNEDGTLKRVVAAHDVGRAVNPVSVEGQVEGGVVMSLGYALTEDYPLKDCVPTAKFGTLGLFRAPQVPPIQVEIIEKNPSDLAAGAKGIGEICSIPTAPAVQGAYYRLDGKFRTQLPLMDTPYERKQNK